MAGVKGRSGGVRPGAGRRPKEPIPGPSEKHDDPLTFLMTVMNDPAQNVTTRVRAAVAAAQYMHVKKGDGGKKEEAEGRAKKTSKGKFSSAAPPAPSLN